MSYTPIFSKIIHSSLWKEEDCVIKVFFTLMALKDYDYVVRMDTHQIADAAKKTEAETVRALEVLSSPDTKRDIKQEHEGRRIKKTEDGWLILNGEFYQKQMTNANRRAYQAKWQRDYRKRQKDIQQHPTAGEIHDLNERRNS